MSEDFSKYVIGAVIKHGYSAYIDCAEFINDDSFSNMRDCVLWSVFRNIYEGNKPPQKVTGAEYIAAANRLGVGHEIKDNTQYLKQLSLIDTEPEAVIRAAKVIRKQQIKRDLELKMELALNDLRTLKIDFETSVDSITNKAESPIYEYIYSLNESSSQIKKMSDGAREYIYQLMSEPREYIGIPSFCNLWNDAVGGGFRPGLDLRSARRKAGKSSWAINDIKYICGKELRIPVLYLDREMPLEAGQLRITSSLAKTHIRKIERGQIEPGSKDHSAILKALNEFEGMPIYYANVALNTFDEILSMIRRWLIRTVSFADDGSVNPCLVIYDYFKLTDSNDIKGNVAEHQLIGFQATQLTNIGLKYNIPISGYVQSNQQKVVSLSDRLSQVCNALTYFVVLEDDELVANQNKWNRVIDIECCRFGEGLAPNDGIAAKLEGQYANIEIIGLLSKLSKEIPKKDSDDDASF